MRGNYVVICEGEDHDLLVRDRRIVLLHHNLESELTVFLLGGDPCACLAAGLYLEWFSYYPGDDNKSMLAHNRETWEESGALDRYRQSSGRFQGWKIALESARALGRSLRLEGR